MNFRFDHNNLNVLNLEKSLRSVSYTHLSRVEMSAVPSGEPVLPELEGAGEPPHAVMPSTIAAPSRTANAFFECLRIPIISPFLVFCMGGITTLYFNPI